MSCANQSWVGAYVLDALEPEEAEDVRRHVAECPMCQDDVVQLSWLPALLRTVSLADVERLEDETTLGSPQRVLDGVIASIADARRRRRPIIALVAVAAAAFVLAAALVSRLGGGLGSTGGRAAIAIQTVDARSHVHAAVTLSQRTWGTELHLTLSRVPPGERCSLIAKARDGRSDVAATWTATYRGTADVPGTTAIPLNQLREIDVVANGGRALARLLIAQPR